MIRIPERNLHRLRQMRDDLEWLGRLVNEEPFKDRPWRHYTLAIGTAQKVVGSLIRNAEQSVKV